MPGLNFFFFELARENALKKRALDGGNRQEKGPLNDRPGVRSWDIAGERGEREGRRRQAAGTAYHSLQMDIQGRTLLDLLYHNPPLLRLRLQTRLDFTSFIFFYTDDWRSNSLGGNVSSPSLQPMALVAILGRITHEWRRVFFALVCTSCSS